MHRFWLLALVCSAVGGPLLAQTYRGNDPPWEGQWIWAPRSPEAPRLDVNLHRWLIARPGGWGGALTHRLVGYAAAAGLSGVDWRLEDEYGRRLYPSSDRDAVLHWTNWGADFASFDYPAEAIRVAERCALPIRLIADSVSVAEEARRRYPGAEVVVASEAGSRATVPAETMEPASLARRWTDRRTHYFRRSFDIEASAVSAEITITAERSYRLYLDGRLIGSDSDWWRGETFDVAPYLAPGRHVLAVVVEPDDAYAGLLLNMRWTSADGAVHRLHSDNTWRVTAAAEEGWNTLQHDDSGWRPAGVYGFEGVGPRFRLKDPWRNPTPVRGGEPLLPDRRVQDVRITTTGGHADAAVLVDGDADDGEVWTTQTYPTTIELRPARPTRLREVRIHQETGDASPFRGLKAYRLETHEDGRWVNLTPPVTDAPTDREVLHHAFSPKRVSRLRLVVLEGGDASSGAACALREIELILAYDEQQ